MTGCISVIASMLVVVCWCFPEMGRQAAVDVFVGLFPPLLFVPKGPP